MALAVQLTASGQVGTGPVRVYGYSIKGGSDAMTVAFANQATASGTELEGYGAATGVYASPNIGNFIDFSVACYATITGTAPVVWVKYSPIPNG